MDVGGHVTLQQAGLYYPYIHFRDEAWLRTAYLYWPSMGRIVPSAYKTHDSNTVQTLRDASDFVIDVSPAPAVEQAGSLFMAALHRHGPVIRRLLQRAEAPGEVETEPIAFVHNTKVARGFSRELETHGFLSRRGAWHGGRHGEAVHRREPEEWIGTPSRLAAVYMCVLADLLARKNLLIPTTDHAGAFTAVGGWDIPKIMRALLDEPAGKTSRRGVDRPVPSEEGVALPALELAIPAGIEHIPLDRLVKVRTQHQPEFFAFRQAVASAAQELSQVPDDLDPVVLRPYIDDVLNRNFTLPQKELKKVLKVARWEWLPGVLNLKFSVPPGLVLAGAAVANPFFMAVGGL